MADPRGVEAARRAESYFRRKILPPWMPSAHLLKDWPTAEMRGMRDALAVYRAVMDGTARKKDMHGQFNQLHRELIYCAYVPGETPVFADWIRDIFPWSDTRKALSEATAIHHVATTSGMSSSVV